MAGHSDAIGGALCVVSSATAKPHGSPRLGGVKTGGANGHPSLPPEHRARSRPMRPHRNEA
eukprot:scaffold3202_cov117-Isochrysis_galbana.AAC.5